MKILKLSLALLLFMALASCGPNKEAEEKEKHREDSLMEIQRNEALHNAEQLLNDSVAADTIKK